ncbi:DUF2339 domain-containing protein [Pararhizobium sp.]|uniref:DUF2339 domain-containing protein n=1 Tax=Pararhizobium sp. TaxID=1977563 RepID=UPI0027274992|nr:DUF2339 domain-containing protein [Pararhizobium sp.]MDO9417507.1 DUF2339 domain-containing protein [Pararhizobium sp.]
MLELLVLAAIAFSIGALVKASNTSERVKKEVASLRGEIAALRDAQPVAGAAVASPAVASPAVASVADASPAVAAVVQADTVSEIPAPVDEHTAEPVSEPGPWSTQKTGDAIFGGAVSSEQERVEKASRGEPVPRPALAAAQKSTATRESLESRLGARWAVWVGGLALALGGVFMVKYSIESGLLSPAVRLAFAAIFGLVLVVAGEVVRRRAVPEIASDFRNAMIPGILTAAGALTLFGVVYAAHGIYGFIGPVAGFVLLAAVALGTVGLSLLHGQALAGIGLLGSLATPALVTSDSSDPWTLFGFLSVAWLATLLASRIRRWNTVPSLANAGIGGWLILYMLSGEIVEILPVTLTLVLMIAAVGILWPGNVIIASDEAADAVESQKTPPGPWEKTLLPPHLGITLTLALFAIFPALIMVSPFLEEVGDPVIGFAAVVAALALLGALRGYAAWPALFAAVTAMAGVLSLTAGGTVAVLAPLDPSAPVADIVTTVAMALAALFAALGGWAIVAWLQRQPVYAVIWSVITTGVPVVLLGISFLMTGNFAFDIWHGLAAITAGLFLVGLAVFVSKRPVPPENIHLPQGFLVAGSFGAFVLALHALTAGLATTILIAVLGFAYVAATRLRHWPILPWMQVAAAVAILGRIAWQPTLVGPAALSTTPVFNQLLAGYGIPALLLAISAYELRNWPGLRVRNLLQALASLFVLLTIAILVRHAMNGGVLNDAVPTLGEQSIYTLLAIGASGILMTLDLRSPSPVFRYGSMTLGVISMLSILSAHLVGLNPYFSGELLGRIPVVDLLLIGYLLPGLAYAALAVYARGKRPAPYVMALAVTGAILAFAWTTLSVRRFWQGESIADWKGFLNGETYTYSVVWLLLGVLLLALGSKLNAKSIRIASAGLVFIAVLKVFLIDMSNLEGFLRALSFIGLGVVLIGIGLFYQKILSGKAGQAAEAVVEETPPEPEPEATAHV